ncbi:polysaccharide biosynthesis/export family protein [Bacteroides sp. UBA939]|uniref:polysaccharide biosynthesis/export family protein n=1 Tax=Bacteroides sp. UBA939 TaxID=1946092 RepID=UPI0025C29075|nr:polysaccharide biosynthesis/export family protein [Bacteroides sp. UBA939]
MKIKTLVPVLSLLLLVSCKTTDNSITYFQDLDNQPAAIAGEPVNYAPRIAPDDQLSIIVSGTDPSAVAAFNMPLASYLAPGETNVVSTPVLHTYLVNSGGEIDFPVLGKLHIAGMTRNELTDVLTEKVSAYVKSPIVTIQIRNFKVSVLGEVNRPGTVNVPNERLSVLDALGLAGDLTIYGNRTNVLLIRDNNGKKEFHRFDLTSAGTLTSPYYYLQQNDVLYVEPNKARKGNAKYSQSGQFNISLASTVISALSVLASLAIALLVK